MKLEDAHVLVIDRMMDGPAQIKQFAMLPVKI